MATRVLTNTFYSSINIYLEYFLGLVVSILIARALGAQEYGLYSYFIWLASLAVVIANAGVSTGVIKFLSEVSLQADPQLTQSVYRFFGRLQLVKAAMVISGLLLLVFAVPGNLLGIDAENRLWMLLLVLAIVLKSQHMFRVSALKGLERFKALAIVVMIVSPINLACVWGAHYYALDAWAYWVIYTLTCSLYCLVSWLYLLRLSRAGGPVQLPDALRQRMQHHFRVVSINVVISFLVLGQSELFFLNHLASREAVAFFNIGFVLSQAAMMLVPGVYTSVLLPIIARAVADIQQNPAVKVYESTRYLFTLSLMVAVPVAYYAQDIVALLYGQGFSQAGWVFACLLLLGVVKSFNGAATAYLVSSDRQTTLLKIYTVAAVLGLSLDYVLILHWALLGAVIGNIVIALGVVGSILCIAYRQLGPGMKVNKLLKTLCMALLALPLAVVPDLLLPSPWNFLAGGVLFVLSYSLLLIASNALGTADYRVILELAQRIHPKVHSLCERLLARRLYN